MQTAYGHGTNMTQINLRDQSAPTMTFKSRVSV